MKRTFFLLLWIVSVGQLWASDQITFRAVAPETVVEGERFMLQYTINTGDAGEVRIPEIDNFRVLYSNGRSTQTSYQIINGKRSGGTSVTYTYTLAALKQGNYQIPAATIQAGGKTYQSNSLRIKVLPPDQTAPAQSQRPSGGGQGSMRTQSAGSAITGKDLFITVTANKRKVYEQEAVLLTYKVYSLVSLTNLSGKMPELQGFHTQEIDLPAQKSLSLEHYNDRNYGTATWSQYVLFPQHAGKLTVPAINFEATIVQQNRNIDPIDAFFSGNMGRVEVEKTIVAPAVTIEVEPLPTKPANFSGGVGNFSIKSSIDKQALKTNEALNLKIVLSGTGNMKLIKNPEIKFPEGFETYPVKIDDKTKLTSGGLSGTKTFDYLAIPRRAGKFTIPAVKFIYFNPESGEYVTVSTESYEVDVEKGAGGSSQGMSDFTGKEDLRLLGEDIHYIKLGEPLYYDEANSFFGSMRYYLYLVIPFLLFVILLIAFRKRALENANETKLRGKKANSVAVKRLKTAKKLLVANNKGLFYDEVLKALWGYISDKLSIPVAELNKENVSERLLARGVDDTLVKHFIQTLDECEFARFAPSDPSFAMDKVYEDASNVIGQMENSIKR